jgi:hypothetical protein
MTEKDQATFLNLMQRNSETWRVYMNIAWDAAILENALRSLQAGGFCLTTILELSDLHFKTKREIKAYLEYWIEPAIQQLSRIVEEK